MGRVGEVGGFWQQGAHVADLVQGQGQGLAVGPGHHRALCASLLQAPGDLLGLVQVSAALGGPVQGLGGLALAVQYRVFGVPESVDLYVATRAGDQDLLGAGGL